MQKETDNARSILIYAKPNDEDGIGALSQSTPGWIAWLIIPNQAW